MRAPVAGGVGAARPLAHALPPRLVRPPALLCEAKAKTKRKWRAPKKRAVVDAMRNVTYGDDIPGMLLGLVQQARAPKVLCLGQDVELPEGALVASPSGNGTYALRSHEVLRTLLEGGRSTPFSQPGPTSADSASSSTSTRASSGSSASTSSTALAQFNASVMTNNLDTPEGTDLIRAVRRPSTLDFHTMYRQLEAWTQKYKCSHVPRQCFDAPALGAWVWWLRHAKKRGRLLQWQVDLVTKLDFEWVVDRDDAKWFNEYHQLRRFKMIHGTASIPDDFVDRTDSDFARIKAWAKRQARAYTKGNLSGQKLAMLELLGVELQVDEAKVQKQAQLQGLNAMERRQLRRGWKREEEQERERRAKQRALKAAEEAASERLLQDEERRRRFREILQERQEGVKYIGGLAVKVGQS